MRERAQPGLPELFDRMQETWIEGIEGGGGAGWPLRVKVARTPAEAAAGFQHVPEDVLRRSAIWFALPCGAPVVFHMRNVAAPLDIAFIDGAGRVLETARMEPGDGLWPAPAGTCHALEVPAGRLARLGVAPGTVLRLPFTLRR